MAGYHWWLPPKFSIWTGVTIAAPSDAGKRRDLQGDKLFMWLSVKASIFFPHWFFPFFCLPSPFYCIWEWQEEILVLELPCPVPVWIKSNAEWVKGTESQFSDTFIPSLESLCSGIINLDRATKNQRNVFTVLLMGLCCNPINLMELLLHGL